MKNLIFGLLLFSLLTSGFTCHDCDEELYGSATFEATIDSELVEYQNGDTITIRTDFNALLELNGTSDVYDIRNQISTNALSIFGVRPNNSPLVDAISDFTTLPGNINTQVNHEVGNSFVTIESLCDNNCSFEVKLIPNKNGIFLFKLLGRSLLSDHCNNVGLNGNFDVAENNFSLCSEVNTNSIQYPNGGGTFRTPEIDESLYFFKVVD